MGGGIRKIFAGGNSDYIVECAYEMAEIIETCGELCKEACKPRRFLRCKNCLRLY